MLDTKTLPSSGTMMHCRCQATSATPHFGPGWHKTAALHSLSAGSCQNTVLATLSAGRPGRGMGL